MTDNPEPPEEPGQDTESIAGETKRERFVRVAERRTNNVLYRIRVLSNCANRYSYEFAAEDVDLIFKAIERELERARARFEISAPSKFSLGETPPLEDGASSAEAQEEEV